MKCVLATGNANKVREMMPLFPENWELVNLRDFGFSGDLQEDHQLIEDNSLQKAMFIWKKYGLPCIAEDTGLFVEILNGEPGVHSAHYAGPSRSSTDNIALLLKKMQGKENRKAAFRTVMTFVDKGVAYQFEGSLQGAISNKPSGDGGFGYDPVFEIKDGVTLAMISSEEKQKISHRSQALNKLLAFIFDVNINRI